MALISASTIISSLSLFHITLGFFFLTSPITIADQTLVFIIGEAMKLPYKRSFENQSPPLAFLAAVLFLLGISDLASISKVDELTQLHWGAQAPIRLLIFFILTFYAFMFSKSSPIYATTSYVPSSWGEGLKNRVFFTWAFIEMIAWFWVYVTLREERKELSLRKQQKKSAEESD
ncbi:hypothetical protein HI914_01755 [Erysiphe necator]|uniref:Increased loss of mitochondrial dna protein 1 n=1 Tax=Uncinula necator TaxID=52586 RepID=A0A0B1NXM1_UNCNE|nr:hypothetical protein HI914_01755 [Erysiphe necator]KHJ30723.1 putative protein ilm1 [Erysiphe necator]